MPQITRASVRWFSERQKLKRGRRSSPRQLVVLRLHDFARLFRSRYGTRLPDDDSGRDDLAPVLQHIASMPQPKQRATKWLELWAPWLTLGEQRQVIADAITDARAWSADQLAWRYHLAKEERTMLGITTIGAIGSSKAARTKRRKERDRARKASLRRAQGAKPRGEYLAASLSRSQPWKALGISRRTWERRRKSHTDASPATA